MRTQEVNARFQENLNRIMTERGLLQKQIAEELDTTPQNVSLWCKGVSKPKRPKMVELASFLDVNVHSLLE